MSKISDQPKDEKILDREEIEEVSGGVEEAYEEPEVTKAEMDGAEPGKCPKCESQVFDYSYYPSCLF